MNQNDATKAILALLENKSKEITFVLMGRSGVGKSSTINSLLGAEVARVGKYEPTTMDVTAYHHEHEGIKYRIYDTPGLCDELPEAGNDQRYLEKISATVKETDVLWFVTELDATRVSGDEKRGIKLISQGLGPEIWRHAVIIFTRADKTTAGAFDTDLAQRTGMIRQEIAKYAPALANAIPSVAVSNGSDTLPSGRPWLGELFTKTFERITDQGAFRLLLSMAKDIGIDKESGAPARIVLDDHQRERIKTSGSERMVNAAKGAAAGAAIGSFFGPVGTAAGVGLGAIIGFLF